ncbi:MAG: alkaline phytoceramidase [Nitrosomonas sp.]|nr:alkaline phytoceramidase [Nitrosomonas sp.]
MKNSSFYLTGPPVEKVLLYNNSAFLWWYGLILLMIAMIMPPIAQSQLYHAFADQRGFLGIPNFGDVVSNLPFLLIGATGIIFLQHDKWYGRKKDLTGSRSAYQLVFLSTVLAFPSSAYYHWAPNNTSLLLDRLPIAIGMMALLAAVLLERISLRRPNLLLTAFVSLGAASVVYWYWSEQNGAGNLNFYITVQFGALLLVALLARFYPSRHSRAHDLYGVLGWYGLAKIAEMLDEPIY